MLDHTYSCRDWLTRSPGWRRTRSLLLGLLALFTVTSPVALAQGEKPTGPLKVATRVVPPFVMEENGKLDGFSVELWEGICERLGIKCEFVMTSTVADLLAAVKSGKADVGIAAISITAGRNQEFDFSQPILESGLQIMVRDQGGGSGTSSGLLSLLFSPTLFQLLGLMLLLILVPAHIVWFIERRHKEGLCETEAYFPGIFKACWWAGATLATQADEMPRSPLGRVAALIWMFVGVLFVAYFTAAVTTSMTVRQLRGDIQGPRDLPGKQVATIKGSTSAAYLAGAKIRTLEFTRIDEAYNALLNERADAVVYDSPVLLYYAAREGKGKVRVVGNIFRRESYGIALPMSSPYRKPIDHALLSLQEDGTYQELYEKWFHAEE
jgi:polar amino acid transport system substrate-binding protein